MAESAQSADGSWPYARPPKDMVVGRSHRRYAQWAWVLVKKRTLRTLVGNAPPRVFSGFL
jgi:hypothetical protein